MPVIRKTRAAQYPLMAEFTFGFDDTMTNTAGVSDGFSSVASHVFDAIPLPPNAVVVGGDVVTETAVTGATAYNISVGDSGSTTRYLGVTDRVAAGRTVLVLTGFVATTGQDVRLTVTPTVAAATAGRVTLRVLYTIRDRASETTIS